MHAKIVKWFKNKNKRKFTMSAPVVTGEIQSGLDFMGLKTIYRVQCP
jgi:hypothetical protein